jgi:hypothetical protein
MKPADLKVCATCSQTIDILEGVAQGFSPASCL